jgi:hypothetical protein
LSRLGHKSVAAENEITKRVYFPAAPELKAISQSEEHLVIDAGKTHSTKWAMSCLEYLFIFALP